MVVEKLLRFWPWKVRKLSFDPKQIETFAIHIKFVDNSDIQGQYLLPSKLFKTKTHRALTGTLGIARIKWKSLLGQMPKVPPAPGLRLFILPSAPIQLPLACFFNERSGFPFFMEILNDGWEQNPRFMYLPNGAWRDRNLSLRQQNVCGIRALARMAGYEINIHQPICLRSWASLAAVWAARKAHQLQQEPLCLGCCWKLAWWDCFAQFLLVLQSVFCE